MDEELRKRKLRFLEMTEKPEPVIADLVTWSKLYALPGSLATYRKPRLIIFTVANFLAFDVIGSFAFGTSFGFIDAGEDLCDLIRMIDVRGEVLNALGLHRPRKSDSSWRQSHCRDFHTRWRRLQFLLANLQLIYADMNADHCEHADLWPVER